MTLVIDDSTTHRYKGAKGSLVSEVLFGYQVEAANRIQEARRILLADQPGLGKTLEVLGALELDGLFTKPANILILTPLVNAQTTWIDSIERFIKPRYDVQVFDLSRGSAKQKANNLAVEQTSEVKMYVANHNAIDMTKAGMRVDLTPIYWDAIIVDESHLVLPMTGTKPTNFYKGLDKLRMTSNTIRIAVSGTPDRGKLENRFGTWSFLYPEIVGFNKYKWLEQNFWIVEQRVAQGRTIKMPKGLKDERIWNLYDRKWMIRRTKAEVLTQLPAKRYINVELELEPKQNLNYFSAQMDYEEKLRSGEDASAGMVFALRSRQAATCQWSEDFEPVIGGESNKLAWLLEWLDERGFIERDAMADNTAKVVIVSQFSKVLHWLKAELANRGIDSVVLDGKASNNERIRIQQEFQDGNLRIVLLSGTMGVGINLDKADDLIMVDSPYDPDRIEQIEDRVHRASNVHHVTIWNLITLNTIDQAIAEKVNARYKVTRQLMDGTRGVDIARKILTQLMKGATNE
jgi:SNF2 family DNA or RNA helicase